MRYIGTVETAKMIRQQLKKNFPQVKFSVRSSLYSMGSSIDISWADGPSKKQVEPVVGPFSGSSFDGMIDMKYSTASYLLPDGSVQYGRSSGTEGSRGSCPAYENELPVGADIVSFGPDHVFLNRSLSRPLMYAVAVQVSEQYGEALPQLNEHNYWAVGTPRSFEERFYRAAQEFAL